MLTVKHEDRQLRIEFTPPGQPTRSIALPEAMIPELNEKIRSVMGTDDGESDGEDAEEGAPETASTPSTPVGGTDAAEDEDSSR